MSETASNLRSRLLPIVLAQGVGLACGVIGVKVTSALVPPAALGAYGVFLTLATVGTSVVYAGHVKFVGRHWAAAPDRAGLLRAMLGSWRNRLPWLVAASAAGAYMVGRLADGSAVIVFAALLIAMAMLSLAGLAQAALQAAREHWKDCAAGTSAALTRTFAPPLLFLWLGSVSGLYLGFCFHALAVALVAALGLRAFWRPPDGSRSQLPPLTTDYDGPLFTVLAVAGWALAGMNRWVVAGFFGQTAAGYFTLAGGAAALIPAMLGTVALQYFQPNFFAAGDDRHPGSREGLARRVDVVAAACSAVALVGLLTLSAVAPRLVGPLINENYRAALVWILPGGCFSLTLTTGLFFHSLLLAGRRERGCGPVDLTAAGVLVAGSIAAAALGEVWFQRWLMATPVLPWLLNRPLARRYFFQPSASPTPAPDR